MEVTLSTINANWKRYTELKEGIHRLDEEGGVEVAEAAEVGEEEVGEVQACAAYHLRKKG